MVPRFRQRSPDGQWPRVLSRRSAVLSLAVEAPNAVDLTFIRGVNASLTVKKID